MSWLSRISMTLGAVLCTLGAPVDAEVENTATALAQYGDQPVESAISMVSVAVVDAQPSVRLVKTIDRIEDSNENGRVDAGDTVIYRFDVENTGNLTLETLQLVDPRIGYESDPFGPLAPATLETSLEARYRLTQADLDVGGFENSATVEAQPAKPAEGEARPAISDISDAGDEEVETAGWDGATDDDPTNDPTVLILEQLVELQLGKAIATIDQIFPYVYDVTYVIDVENTGTVTANDIVLSDDVESSVAPAALIVAHAISVDGDLGGDILYSDFTGTEEGSTQLLQNGLSLSPGGTLAVTLVARVEVPPNLFTSGLASVGNQSDLNLPELDGAVLSVAKTGPTTGEIAPTYAQLFDADRDGILDNAEDGGVIGAEGSDDRDGDGIANDKDYDPIGYFYCEETGEILTGGRISVTSSTGSNAAVRIVEDGSSGAYQWYVTQPGTYVMSYTLPPRTEDSLTRMPGGRLDLSNFAGPLVVLGSGEMNNSGYLADYSEAGNPFHLTFEIEAGDPHIINNNIPVRFCGMPELAVSKSLDGEPTRLADGRTRLSYVIEVENTGDSQAMDVSLRDPLSNVFGEGRFEVTGVTLEAPTSYTGIVNPSYDGSTDNSLLTPYGDLEAGEKLTVHLDLIVAPERDGEYVNVVVAGMISRITDRVMDRVRADEAVILQAAAQPLDLRIAKTVSQPSARIGEVVTFAVEVENRGALPVSGLRLVDDLPDGLIYVDGSARIDGVAQEPVVFAHLNWNNFDIPAGATRVLTLATQVISGAAQGRLENQAWMATMATDSRVSPVASAALSVIAEPTFDCTDVIGKVFEDRNSNGYQDPPPDPRAAITDQTYYSDGKFDVAPEVVDQQENGEPGIPSVNLVTPSGDIVTTDSYGRFSVPCAMLPGARGANFTLKLDERSLPTGFRVTTENPRTMRLTPGIMTEMNFGATLGNLVDVDLTGAAFPANSSRPSAALADGVDTLVRQIASTPSVLRITYYRNGESAELARARLREVEDLIQRRWRGNYRLRIETTIARMR